MNNSKSWELNLRGVTFSKQMKKKVWCIDVCLPVKYWEADALVKISNFLLARILKSDHKLFSTTYQIYKIGIKCCTLETNGGVTCI